MTAAQFEGLEEVEAAEILHWRFHTLVGAGYEPSDAVVLASRVDVDLHEATDLIGRVCPGATAVRILL
jgi:hypothetical protein